MKIRPQTFFSLVFAREAMLEIEQKFVYSFTIDRWKFILELIRSSLLILFLKRNLDLDNDMLFSIWEWDPTKNSYRTTNLVSRDSLIISTIHQIRDILCLTQWARKIKKSPGQKNSWNQINQFHEKFFLNFP